jgi:succinate dehydrogenase / fumarate reductase cytochrome b subunit
MYRGREGYIAWIFHRVSGLAILFFLGMHIYETMLINWGPEAYNHGLALYKQPWFRPFEVLLVAAVLYHALNGTRIMLFDFWPGLVDRHRSITVIFAILFVLVMVPVTWTMMAPVFGGGA